MKDHSLSGGLPYGAIALFAIAFLLYSGFLANLLGSRGTDLAGRGMALGFAAIIGAVLWMVLTGLFVLAWFNGRLAGWLAVGALIALPLSAIAAAAAAGLAEERGYWLMAAPILLPPLLALLALWGRLPALHGVLPVLPTSAVLGGAIVLLTVVPLVVGWIDTMPNPERDAARAEQQRLYEQETQRRAQQAREEEEARFARLGPDSSLSDYLDFLPPGDPRSGAALAGARLVKSRAADAAALLKEGKIDDLPALWRLDIDPAAVCEAYGAALQAAAAKIDRTRSNYIGIAIDLERQLPNIKWLSAARCDIGEAISVLETRVRAVSDSPRLVAFADALASVRQPR
ncbi:MAG: hypothetical protein GEV13_34935 [Rhodospirillales bacterium]|nr:hypothetical protein [Rhodospirillales bacterium]